MSFSRPAIFISALTIATHTPADPCEFLTNFGLPAPGTRASFKVYVILETGNEAGSPAMNVERRVFAWRMSTAA